MHSGFVRVCERNLEYLLIPAHQINRPTLVLLHEGLGSVAMWRDFPERLAAATGCRTLVYSRYGYGQSDVLAEAFATDFMHREGREVLTELLAELDIENPVLVGHSDGASIALLHAGDSRSKVAGLVVMAPHCFVEDISIRSIQAAKVAFETTDLPAKLAKYHHDVRRTFYGWNDIWLHTDFRSWNIEDCLSHIRCPILAIQGVDDEYGTMAQIEAIAAQATASPDVELLKLADCRHSPHRDQTLAVIEAIGRFADRVDTAVPPAPTF
ncbi:MAG: alpha/beta hydrolase [Rhodocyclales bacterium]|nr:alpha/beta hydrolase [Rhodocyclales bacterium]